MEYVYAAMLLHKAKKTIDEASVKKVLDAAGVATEDAKVKALIAALDGVDIEEAIKKNSIMAAPVTGGVAPAEAPAEAKEEAKEEKKDDGQAAAGLGALFG